MSDKSSSRTSLIEGATYTHRTAEGWVWVALTSMSIKFIGSASPDKQGEIVHLTEEAYILTHPQEWIITLPFNNYYEAIQK